MAVISLAVKYRPNKFEDLVEQESIKQILEYQIESKTFVHAYLFTGPAGCGKTTSARIFADGVNSGKGTPIEVDAASNTGVDNIRLIIEDAKKKPLDSEYKIFILDESHMLSNGAWNALLKILEEPPKQTIFIMCTTDPQKIPATILSRVQRYDFNKMSLKAIANRLRYIADSEKRLIDDSAINYIAKLSNGGMRDAITTMDKCFSLVTEKPVVAIEDVLSVTGTVDYGTYFNFLRYFTTGDKNGALEILNNVFDNGVDIKNFLKEFMYFVSDVALVKMFGDINKSSIPDIEDYKERIDDEDLDSLIDLLNFIIKVDSEIKWSSNPKMVFQCYIVAK